jgi:hypothetical protein
MASGLSAIDWQAPWLSPWREHGQPIAHSVAQGAQVYEACNQHLKSVAPTPKCPVQFVAQSELSEGMAYEQFIFEHKAVPTRDGLHDFFNALCWLHFPLAKQQLNRVQAMAIQAQGVGAVRGPVRDAVTVFDENACLIQVPDDIWNALHLRQWPTAFVTLRQLWQGAQVQIFGHAALEKLVNPYKAIAVHLWRVPSGLPLDQWDAWLAEDLQAEKLARKPFLPTPVLGVPGWWADNETPNFYDDTQVFRLPRRT